MYKYKFTVFTATYNRGHLLNRIYDCLKKQTFKDFEWLIVDDGSTDNTYKVIEKWINNENIISINYIYKVNGGKHTAFNRGVMEAKGELFLTLDSDDLLVENALEVFYSEWINISNREMFSSVAGLCIDMKGMIIGTKYPIDSLDSDSIEIREFYKVKGDKSAFTCTDILKDHCFPVFKNEKFITEGVIIEPIAAKYKTRFINKIVCIVDYQNNGLSSDSMRLRVKNPNGTIYYYNQSLLFSNSLKRKIRNSINYNRFSLHAKKNIIYIIKNSNKKFLCMISILPSYLLYLIDLYKLNKKVKI